MKTEIVVNVTSRETRVAILEDGQLAELKIERGSEITGNVYMGKVERVVPGLDAAFVDIGVDRNAFLYVADAVDEELAEKVWQNNRNGKPEPPAPQPRGRRRGRRGQPAAKAEPEVPTLPPIGKVLKGGQQVLVQVSKGPIGTKGARVTTHLSLPGKYSVLMPQGSTKLGISKKIESEKERLRLRKIVEKLKPKEMGLIIRTQAEGMTQRDLTRDIRYLERTWHKLRRTAEKVTPPALVHEEPGLSHEILRDVFSEDVESFIIDDKRTYDQVVEFLAIMAPKLRKRVQLFEGDEAIFEKYGIEGQYQNALKREVPLKSGGAIVIDPTEALTAIDVNSGKSTAGGSLDDMVLQTNLQAADEICRQLRLRDIGGIIVIDFIDMEVASHKRQVTEALKNNLKQDRMKTRVVHLTPLGLIEMTRKRTGENLQSKVYVDCPTCDGRGRVLGPDSVCINVEAELQRLAKTSKFKALRVIAHPSVALTLLGHEGQMGEQLEEELGKQLFVHCANRVHPETYRIEEGAVKQFSRDYDFLQPKKRMIVRPHQLLHTAIGGWAAVVSGSPIYLPEDIDEKAKHGLEVRLTRRRRSSATAVVEGPAPAPKETDDDDLGGARGDL